MKQLRRLLSSPAVTVGAFALAACLLAFSTIGGTRAALTYYSENYVSTVQMHELGVSLVENGAVVATGNAVTSARAAREGEQMSALLGTLIGSSILLLTIIRYERARGNARPASVARGAEEDVHGGVLRHA